MAHYAKVRDGVVVEVIVADRELFTDGNFVDTSPGYWIKTSYNTDKGVYYTPNTMVNGQTVRVVDPDQTKALRGNFAGVGMVYDMEHDVFYSKQPYPSWILNTTTWTWEAPVICPGNPDADGYFYDWNETTTSWVTQPNTQVFDTPFDPEVNPFVPPTPIGLPPI
jgi:hypothetical protein